MKEFSCKSMGSDCNVTLTAPTDARLAEMAARHLREAHGTNAISEDKLGQIKKKFVNRSTADAAYVVDRIFEKYNCDSDPECTWRYIMEAESILTGRPSVHEKELKAA